MTPRIAVLAVALVGCTVAGAQDQEPAYLSTMGATGRRGSLGMIRAEAHVTVSDGLEFDVVTLFQDHQRATFHRRYPDRTITLGVEGEYFWSFDGRRQTEGPPVYRTVVLGHQFHAQLLFFDVLYGPLEARDEGGLPSYVGSLGHTLQVNAGTGRPRRLLLPREGGADIEVLFEDWRALDDVVLPFHVAIDDGERAFDYRFASVTFGKASLDELRAPMELLTDEQRLLRLHRIAMDAHLTGDAALMDGRFGDEVVLVSQGEVHPTPTADFELVMDRILKSRRHVRYDDLIRPIVRVSADGSLGWVIAQVGAAGVRLDEAGGDADPFDFTSAWISLFAKSENGWKMIGNVSNFKPAAR